MDLPDNRWAPTGEGGSYREPQPYWRVRAVIEADPRRVPYDEARKDLAFFVSQQMEEHAIISVLGERIAQVLRWARAESWYGRRGRYWVEVSRVTL